MPFSDEESHPLQIFLKQKYVSTFQISPFKLRKMEIYAYSIEDSSWWKGITSIANIPTLNKGNLVTSTFQISSSKLRKMETFAYSIKDSFQWRGITFIANIPILNKRTLPLFKFHLPNYERWKFLLTLSRISLSDEESHPLQISQP